jgi:sulfoxide reductase heme-binding subunit YedZ
MLIWYLARGAGISAFVMLSLATAAGALTSRRGNANGAIGRRLVLQYVHRSAALTGLALLALHITTILADRYAGVGAAGALLPLASGYRPVAVSFGVLAMYLLAGAVVTGLLRTRFARSGSTARRWRSIHLTGYLAWACAGWHFYTVGTDAGQWWARLVLLGGVGAVALGLFGRLASSGGVRSTSASATGRQPDPDRNQEVDRNRELDRNREPDRNCELDRNQELVRIGGSR